MNTSDYNSPTPIINELPKKESFHAPKSFWITIVAIGLNLFLEILLVVTISTGIIKGWDAIAAYVYGLMIISVITLVGFISSTIYWVRAGDLKGFLIWFGNLFVVGFPLSILYAMGNL